MAFTPSMLTKPTISCFTVLRGNFIHQFSQQQQQQNRSRNIESTSAILHFISLAKRCWHRDPSCMKLDLKLFWGHNTAINTFSNNRFSQLQREGASNGIARIYIFCS